MTQSPPPENPGYDPVRSPAPAAAPVAPADRPASPPPATRQPGPDLPAAPVVDEPAGDGEPGPGQPTVRRSRFGGLWVGLIVSAVVLVLLLIFILQNSVTVQVDYFGWSGQLPLAVAILLGVAAGALLVALPGTVRILQLRRKVRHR